MCCAEEESPDSGGEEETPSRSDSVTPDGEPEAPVAQSASYNVLLRRHWKLLLAMLLLWFELLSVQALFSRQGNLQQTLIFVELFARLAGQYTNVLVTPCLDVQKWIRKTLKNSHRLLVLVLVLSGFFFVVYAYQLCKSLPEFKDEPNTWCKKVSTREILTSSALFYIVGGVAWVSAYTYGVTEVNIRSIA